jgi:hypothetical protein
MMFRRRSCLSRECSHPKFLGICPPGVSLTASLRLGGGVSGRQWLVVGPGASENYTAVGSVSSRRGDASTRDAGPTRDS